MSAFDSAHFQTPPSENAPVYAALYENWRKVYAAQLALCDEKLTRNMWIAPGL